MKAGPSPFTLVPFPHSPALDGCHCVTSALAKIYLHAGHPLSEEMLLGLGAGMGFIYWQMKLGAGTYIFVGGRCSSKHFYPDLGRRTGVAIKEITTSSAAKAEAALLEKLAEKRPVMLGGDMGLLPWFSFPIEYHFGGHAFVICGYDGAQTLLGSDLDQHMAGRKKGFYAPITLEQLRKVRGSTHKPFPPKNLRLEFDFSHFRAPGAKEIAEAIAQAADAHLNPPIKNFGIRGMRHTAQQILLWPRIFSAHELCMNLFNLYIFIEIGGTGGGCFRAMYARFLEEAAGIARKPVLAEAAQVFHESARRFTAIALLFKEPRSTEDLAEKIQIASQSFNEIAGIEEEAWRLLARCR